MAKNTFKSWNEINDAIGELAELEYQKQRLESDKNLKINTYEEVYNKEFAPIAEKISFINEGINDFLQKNKSEFSQSKTKKLPNGVIQCRTSTKLVIQDDSKTLELIKKLELNHCISTSVSLNKNVIKTLDNETLKKIKASKVEEDKFTVKANYSELKAVN